MEKASIGLPQVPWEGKSGMVYLKFIVILFPLVIAYAYWQDRLDLEMCDRIKIQHVFLAHVEYYRYAGVSRAIEYEHSGVPVSWRVQLYPIISNRELRYEKHKRFDSIHNLNEAYRSHNGSAPNVDLSLARDIGYSRRWTSFLRITGKRTYGEGFDMNMPPKDGADRTILFVVANESGVLWTEPRDLEINVEDDFANQFRQCREWYRSNEKKVVLGDGTILRLPEAFKFEDFLALCTVDGAEDVEEILIRLR